MKRVNEIIQDYWRHILIGVALVVASFYLIFYGLSTLTPGFSIVEIATLSDSSSLTAISENPIDALYKLVLWVPSALGQHSLLLTRIDTGLFATASIGLFYFVVYSLFSHRIAILTTLLFVTSTGFLHAAHLGAPQIMQIFGLLTLMALLPAYLQLKGKGEIFILYCAAILPTLLLYTPGMFWFIAIGVALTNKRLFRAYSTLAIKHKILISMLILMLLVPLILACIQQPELALTSLGLPNALPAWSEIATRAKDLVLSLFWSGKGPAEIMLVGAPILTLVEFGLIFIGFGVQFRKPKLKSNYFVIGATIFLLLLIILGGVINYLTLVPIFGLLMAGGLFFLLSQWKKVFPINPVAHGVAWLFVSILITTSVLYHTRAFYIAWPHSESTHAAFSESQPEKFKAGDESEDTKPEPSGTTF